MDEQYLISRQEHEEFARRIDDRLNLLEESVRQINELTISVKEMAVNMKNMLEEQKKQGERLETLEKEPAEAHKQIKMVVITAIVTSVIGAIMGAILVLL